MPDEYVVQLDTFVSRFTEKLQAKDTSDLLSIIKSNPTTACAEALAVAITNLAQKRPLEVDALVLPIQALFDAAEAQSIQVYDYDDGSEPVTFHYVFILHLAEFVKDALHETMLHTPKHTEITPSNPTLATALFSASAIKHGLLANTSAPHNFTRQGLQLPETGFDSPGEVERQEVVAIGACLHLYIAGATMKNKLLFKGEDLLQSLRAIEKKRVISYAPGITLLQHTIIDAEGGFIHSDHFPANVWKELFPDQA
ncbi:hypothetical protein Hypma_012933 [Hypsizygus marmoreus]|uniref:Uncharacterized protein n=1 Tax=Hypsizygus marmoreus TaxID=39966 RepID=A0A369JI73_HYPMA|nr:hypothetical protein Hypma_012933 [Hypsizygus marmoreus]